MMEDALATVAVIRPGICMFNSVTRGPVSILIAKFFQHALLHNAIGLYALQFVNIVLPLVLTPYLARVFQPTDFGLYLFFTSISIVNYSFVEYGFNLYGSREISRHSKKNERIAFVISSVVCGQVILAGILATITLFISPLITIFHEHFNLLLMSFMFGTFRALSPMWYFQGIQDVRLPVLVELSGRSISTMLIILLVKSQNQLWLSLAIPCFFAATVTFFHFFLLSRQISVRVVHWFEALTLLKDTFSLCLYRLSSSLYTTGIIVALGFMGNPAAVGFFAGADKIIRGMLTVISPLCAAYFPRITLLFASNKVRARAEIRIVFLAFIALGVGIMLLLLHFASWWVALLLGPGYEPAVPVLQILTPIALMLPLTTSMSLLYLLPNGLESKLNIITLLLKC